MSRQIRKMKEYLNISDRISFALVVCTFALVVLSGIVAWRLVDTCKAISTLETELEQMRQGNN
jgi:hypothetical protein